MAFALVVAGCSAKPADRASLQGIVGTSGSGLNASNDHALQLAQDQTPTRHASDTDNANIAKISAQILDADNFVKLPHHDQVSVHLMDQYLDALDPSHLYFIQTDLDEFSKWRKTLEDDLLDRGDLTAANEIFARLLERIDQQLDYVTNALKTEEFTFTGNEMYALDRKKMARPADLDAAKQAWHDRLRYEYLQEKLNKQKPEEIVKVLTRRYSRLGHALHAYDKDDVLEVFLLALAHSYDPHSDYFGKSSYDNFNISMKLSLVGIGAQLQSEDGYCKIVELIPGGPAIKSAKLKPGDRVVAVAQGDKEPVDVVDMKLDKIVDLIRGQKGTEVRLTILPSDATDPSTRRVVKLMRDEIKLEESEAKARLIEQPDGKGKMQRLGVIDLPSFYASTDNDGHVLKSTTADVAKLLRKLKAEKVDGIILDLRRNGGGSLDEAIRLTGLFIKQGPVVQVRDSDGKIQVDRDPDPTVLYDGPMIVLISKFSASASEILAGALQDYDRAAIVGDSSTFGKGTVQTVVQLGPVMQRIPVKISTEPGALKLTIQKFFRPSGASTQLKGVVPDVILPSLNNYTDIGEKNLDNPLAWDTIPGAPFDKLNRVQPIARELRKRSESRIASDKDFAYLHLEIEKFKKLMASKSVSMNEAQRIQEKKDAEALAQTRKKELLARPKTTEKDYLITLKLADKPGLPAPMSPKDTKPTAALDADPEATPLDAKAPTLDITLQEAKHILADMVALSPKSAASR